MLPAEFVESRSVLLESEDGRMVDGAVGQTAGGSFRPVQCDTRPTVAFPGAVGQAAGSRVAVDHGDVCDEGSYG